MHRCGFGIVACRLAMLTPPSRHMKVMQQNVAESRRLAKARREELPAPTARQEKLRRSRQERDAFLARVRLLFEMQPVAKPPTEPVPKPTLEVVAKPTLEVVAKPAAEPVAKPAPEPVAKATPEMVPKAARPALPGPLQRVPLKKGSRWSEASTAAPSSLEPSRDSSPRLAELESALDAVVAPRGLVAQGLKRLSEEEEALQKSLLRMDFEEMKRQFSGRKALWRDELMGESFKRDPEREAKLEASLRRLDAKFQDLQQEAPASSAQSLGRSNEHQLKIT